MKFLVPPEMAPGVYRQDVGFFKPGDVLQLPDAASKPDDVPNPRLLPLDEEAQAALKKAHKLDKPIAQRDGSPAPMEEALTLKEAAIKAGAVDPDDKKGKRAADK